MSGCCYRRGGPSRRPIALRAEIWRDEVGCVAIGNSRLALMISDAFAGPLSFHFGERSGGLHLVGASTIGKSIVLLAAGSVWGGGEINGFRCSWQATSNGLEGVAAEHCDTFLPLDEMSEVSPQEAAATVYMMGNGAGKQRATRSGAAARTAKWRVNIGSNGEITLGDKLAEIGKRPRAGQKVRLADIPADAGAGYGAFENLHAFPSAAAFADLWRAMSAVPRAFDRAACSEPSGFCRGAAAETRCLSRRTFAG
jgi:putative DNA primase/helicase